MMAAVDYRAIGASIVSHLQTNLGSGYMVTQDLSAALSHTMPGVSVVVLFQGFTHREELGESPNAPTRDARWTIGIVARADSDEGQDEMVDDAISAIEYYTNPTGHGYPIFDNHDIERSTAVDASKALDDQQGITGAVSVETRIKEA